MSHFQALASDMEVLLVGKKTDRHSSQLSFLGILRDSNRELCRLPAEKASDLHALLEQACAP